MKILVLHGANLNMLGKRDVLHYGTLTLAELNKLVAEYAESKGIKTEFYQSNYEGDLIDILQRTEADAVILNAGAFTHYSYAIRDALTDYGKRVVEVHLSDIMSREDFRKISVFDGVTVAKFYGEKQNSYYKAIDFLVTE